MLFAPRHASGSSDYVWLHHGIRKGWKGIQVWLDIDTQAASPQAPRKDGGMIRHDEPPAPCFFEDHPFLVATLQESKQRRTGERVQKWTNGHPASTLPTKGMVLSQTYPPTPHSFGLTKFGEFLGEIGTQILPVPIYPLYQRQHTRGNLLLARLHNSSFFGDPKGLHSRPSLSL